MRGRIPKYPNFSVLQNQLEVTHPHSPSELLITASNASTSAVQEVPPTTSSAPQNKRTSDKNCRSPSYYGFENSSPDLEITAPPKRRLRAVDFENLQPTNVLVVNIVQTNAEQIPDEDYIPPINGN